MKQRINRASWFLRDGRYYPATDGIIDFTEPAAGPLLSELHYYDNNDGQNYEGGYFDIYGFPPEPESFVKQAAWDEEVARNGGELKTPPELIPPPPIAPEQAEGFKRDVVSHYTVGEIETIDFIADRFDVIEFCLANVVKYASRAKHKGQLRSDLIKIRNYATIALEHMDKNGELE